MKKIYFLIFIFFFSFFYSQCDCAKNFGQHTDDSTLGIEKTSDGFLYDFDFGWTSTDFPVQGQYLMKFDFNCNLLWKKPIQNETFTVDSSDNIYTYNIEGVYQDYTFKIRKYNPVGNLLWEKSILYKGPNTTWLLGNIPRHLFIRNNRLYVAGVYRYDLNFENKVVFHFDYWGYSRARAFVASYTTDGDFIDAKEFGDGKTELIQNFEADNDGNMFITYGDVNSKSYKIHKIDANLQDLLVKTFTNSTGSMRVPTVLHFNKYNSKLYSYDVSIPNITIYNQQAIITEYNPNTLDIIRSLNFNNNSTLQIPSDEGNNNPLFLNRMYFTEENANDMFAFGQFRESLDLNGVKLVSYQAHPGYYSTDLVFFKIDINSLTPQFIFQSTTTDGYNSINAPKEIMMKDGRIFLTGNFNYKKMLLNGTVINNNSGNDDADAFLFRYDVNNTIGTLQSNSPVCIGKDIELTASGGTSYLWSGPNNFSSTLQNPKILNVTTANSGDYSCLITGSGSCAGKFTTNVVVGDYIKPVPDIVNLPKITGDCKTVITTIPTATDNCKGKISATTSNPLTYSLPGNYTITWKYDDGNGNIEIQTQQIEITQQPLPVATSSQSFCKIDNKRISDIAVTASNPKWYDASGNVISDLSTVLLDNTKYYVTQNSNGCESAKKEILITLTDPNAPSGNALQTFCSASNPTLKDLKVTGTGIKWYDSLGKYLPLSTSLKNNETYFASQTVASCESTNKLAIKVNIVTNYLSASDFSDAFCNDTTANSKTINLDDYKKQLIGNPQDYTFDFKNSLGISVSGSTPIYIGENIFDVRIKSSLGCYQDVKLKLRLDRKPESNLPAEREFCDDIIGVILDAGKSPDPIYPYAYSWNTGETSQTIKANQEKTYSVTITTPFGCQNTYSTIVKKAKLANIQNILITNNSITVIMSEAGNYLYSLDEINWQSSNKFENLKNDVYTLFVKNVYDCRLGSKTFTIFSLSNIFSPNDDGSNDTWKVTGIENYPNSQIKIVDKNGRMVVNTVTQKGFEWDGKFNGHKLPSDSYWYQIKLSDGRILEGYVVIKNRN